MFYDTAEAPGPEAGFRKGFFRPLQQRVNWRRYGKGFPCLPSLSASKGQSPVDRFDSVRQLDRLAWPYLPLETPD
jgi:hypothetical protein